MKKLLFILLSVFSFPIAALMAQQKKVAVYVIGEDAGVNKVLGSKLESAIARSEEYSAIERTESFLAELRKEQNYQYSGAVDDSELSRLGKQFGVQYICVAAVYDAFGEKYLSARLIDVETAQVERTASSSGAIQSLESLVSAANSVSNDLLSSLGKGRKSNSKKVAVYVVKNEAGKDIGRVLGDKLVSGFANSGRYIAIERTNSFLAQLSKEQLYQNSGAVDDSELSRLGKQFGVQYVCVADVSEVFKEKYISARLIDVETAEVVNTHEVGGKMNDMSECLRMANEIATNLSKGTFAEQAEEARIRAEQERIRAEQEAIRREQERLRQIEEKRLAEQRRKEAAEKAERERVQALKNRHWKELLNSRITTVTRKYDYGWSIGRGGKGRLIMNYSINSVDIVGWYEGYDGMGMLVCSDGRNVKNCPSGTVYVGEWKKGKKHGKGTIYDKNGKLIYYGKFLYDRPTGKYPSKGSYSLYTFEIRNYNDGNKYVGEMYKGQKHGQGLYIWAEGNGVAWYGNWTNGIRDGFGLYIGNNGSYWFTGRWKGDTQL